MNVLISENFEWHAKKVPKLSQGMNVIHEKNFIAIDSGLACDTFNIIYIKEPKLSTEQLERILSLYQSKDYPYCIWINRGNLSSNIQALFREFSIKQQAEEVGMALNLDNYRPIDDPRHQTIKQVSNAAMLGAYATVIAENWSPPDQNVLSYYERTSTHYLNPDNKIVLLIYYHEGQPVSCVELFPSDDHTVGFYGFATLEKFRGLGIGTTLLTFALNTAKELGYKNAILQGTEDGLNIYKKMGFKEYTTFYEFA